MSSVRTRAAVKPIHWFVYMAECADGSLYTGIARDVKARIAAHDRGRGARYTRGRGPLRVLLTKRFDRHGDALRLEWMLKQLTRDQKLSLVGSRSRLSRLARLARAGG